MDAYAAAIALLAELVLKVIHDNTIQPNPENNMNREVTGNQSGKFGESG